ncbi:MAG: chromosomal replication initiator protein DnaA [Ignavibacteriales bacterium]|nr:chromosomal replication initiator protein DnaA [Ignavibacteriales bacterium]
MDVFETHSSPVVVDAGVQDVWRQCLNKIQKQVTSLGYKTWFQPIVPIKLVEKDITVQVPSQFFYDWVDQHYNALIRETISSVLGEGAKLYYSIASEDVEPVLQIEQEALGQPALSREVSPATPQSQPFFPPRTAFRQSDQPIAQSNLNPRYTFENFIKGDSNQLARAAALAVGNNPGGTSFNPLVVYGGTGLGKTHLMHALGNHAIAMGKAKRVVYVSSEKFTIEFVESIQSDRVNEFSTFYRSVDLLIVDDIQFFSGKEKTQDNFFHTFNTLYQLGKQIVLSSDVPPKELKGLDDRLISRFQSGLTADIQPPDLETRIAILRKKSEDNRFELPQDVVDFIAINVTSNIRELEGCLISLIARVSLDNREITVELARDVLRMVVNESKSPINIDQIQHIVCEFFDIPEDLLRAKTRKQEVVNARQIAMYLSKELTNSSLKTIGLHFGGRDHSTVIHSCQTIHDRITSDSAFKQNVDQLRRRIAVGGR